MSIPLACRRLAWLLFFVASAALLGRERREAIRALEQRESLRKKAAELEKDVASLEEQNHDALRQIRLAKGQADQEAADELEMARLRTELSQQTAQLTPVPLGRADVLAVRVARLRQQLIANNQGDKLPLLTAQDWLEAAADLDTDSEDAFKKATANLAWRAKTHFADAALRAIEQFSQDHAGQWPENTGQIKGLMNEPAASMVDSFKLAPPGSVHPPSPGPKDAGLARQWAMVESTTGALSSEMRLTIYPGGFYGQGGP
jgi:hypothetical protein